jgi:hypothetical protein
MSKETSQLLVAFVASETVPITNLSPIFLLSLL